MCCARARTTLTSYGGVNCELGQETFFGGMLMKLVYISAGVVNAEEDRELPGLKKAYRQAEVSTIQKDSMPIGRLDESRKLL